MTKKVNRNDPCPCGSGKKYKKCCGQHGLGKHTATLLDPSKIANTLLGRIYQAGSALSADRKIDVMNKHVTLGKPKQNPQETKEEPIKQENDLS